MEKIEEEQSLIKETFKSSYTYEAALQVRVYKRRWWVLTLFALASSTQSMVWNTWAPIAESSELVFGWSDGEVALFSSVTNISYILLVIPMCMVMDTKGLRFSMILCAGLLAVCTSIRCFTLDPSVFTMMAYLCNLLQGIAATTTFSVPALVSAIWFPPKQRPMATAISTFFNTFGVSVSFIIGPQLVPGPQFSDQPNCTTNDKNSSEFDLDFLQNGSTIIQKSATVSNLDILRTGISSLMFTHCGISIGLLILVLIYFPAKPPHPPSIVASIQRVDYKQALTKILCNGSLWLVVLAGALPVGVSGAWIAIIDVIVKPLGVSQINAGWIGFFNTLVGSISGIIITKFSDLFYRHRKIFLIFLFGCASACCIWFSLMCNLIIEYSMAALFASCVLLGIFINGTKPLFYEMTAEASYPVAEGVTGGFYTMIHDIFATVLLSLVLVPGIGTKWISWTVLGALLSSICLLFVFPEKYKRTDIDMGYTIVIE